jgi:ankyrin repeat protein
MADDHIVFVWQYQRTPLYYAAYNGYLDVAKLLLECGANIEAKNKVEKCSMFKYIIRSSHPILFWILFTNEFTFQFHQ